MRQDTNAATCAAGLRPALLAAAALLLTACGSDSASLGNGSTASAGDSGTIRALSYNVAGLPLLGTLSGDNPATNSPLISPLLNDYELVLLQESWADPLQAFEQAGLLPEGSLPGVLGFHHLIVADAEHPHQSKPASPPLGLELRRGLNGLLGPTLLADGLNRLSWFPFTPVERIMWDACYGSALITPLQELLEALGLDALLEPLGLMGDSGLIDDGSTDCSAQKGFSFARHEIAPGVEIDVYNHHADAGSHDRDLKARVDNFEQLIAFINTHSEGRAVILGGDTNLAFESDRRPQRQVSDGGTWRRVQEETGLTDVCAVLDCGDQDELRAQGFKNHDRFAFRSGGGITLRPLSHAFEREKFTREDGEQLSDHDPVAVDFEWLRAR